jgi:pimeloyl-ACP methyl ester carboxylesterase
MRPYTTIALAMIVVAATCVGCSDEQTADAPVDSDATTSAVSTLSTATTAPAPAPAPAPETVDTTSTVEPAPATPEFAGGPCAPTEYVFPRDLYPFTDRCIDLGHGDYHFVDERPTGEPVGTVLMVHGNPTSSFLYRNVAIDLLARGYRVVMIDHYGFGQSAKPSSDTFGYRPSDHADVLTRFVDELGLQDLTLVVQDWGGPIGLAMAAQRPERIGRVLIMNTWAWQIGPADLGGPYDAVAQWSQLNHELGDQVADSGVIITGAAGGLASGSPEPLATEILDAYRGPFFQPGTDELRTPLAARPTGIFARSIFDDTDIFDTIGDLDTLDGTPVYLYFGGGDPLFGTLRPSADGSCAMGTPSPLIEQPECVDADGAAINPYIDRFTDIFGDDIIGTEVEATGNHFVQEQFPQRVADIIATSLSG